MDRNGGRDHLIIGPFLMWSGFGACSDAFAGRTWARHPRVYNLTWKAGPLGDATRAAVDGGPKIHYLSKFDRIHANPTASPTASPTAHPTARPGSSFDDDARADSRTGWLFAEKGNYQTVPPVSVLVSDPASWMGRPHDRLVRPLLAAYVGGSRGQGSTEKKPSQRSQRLSEDPRQKEKETHMNQRAAAMKKTNPRQRG